MHFKIARFTPLAFLVINFMVSFQLSAAVEYEGIRRGNGISRSSTASPSSTPSTYEGTRSNGKNANSNSFTAKNRTPPSGSAVAKEAGPPVAFIRIMDREGYNRVDYNADAVRGGLPMASYFGFSTDPYGAASEYRFIGTCRGQYWAIIDSKPRLSDGYDLQWAANRPNIHIGVCNSSEAEVIKHLIATCPTTAQAAGLAYLCPQRALSEENEIFIRWGKNEEDQDHRLKTIDGCSYDSFRDQQRALSEACQKVIRIMAEL